VTDEATLRVALADKVHNARSIVRHYRALGHVPRKRRTDKTPRQQLWYYRGLVAFFEHRRPGPLTEDLRQAVDELAWLINNGDSVAASGHASGWSASARMAARAAAGLSAERRAANQA
jgi:hypothetical protein